jgi:hypothetical protein
MRNTVNMSTETVHYLTIRLEAQKQEHEAERVLMREAAFGRFLTEVGASNKRIVAYIEGDCVTEPFRIIVDERSRKQASIFEPKPHEGSPEVDALIIKILRSRSGSLAILRIEGLGPAGTVKTPARLVTPRKPLIIFPGIREMPVVFGDREDYNRSDKNTVTPVPLPRKDYVGGEKFGPSWELRKLKDDFREKTRGLSNDKKNDVLRLVFSVARDIINARPESGITSDEFYIQRAQEVLKRKGVVFESQPKPKEPLTPPDLSEIPLWQGREKDGMPLEFIKEHYGQWLSAFGAEEDRVFQDQIRAHDPKLIKGVDNQFRYEKKKRKLRDFVKTRSARVDRELPNVSVENLKEKERLAITLRLRERRAAERGSAVSQRPVVSKK